MLGLLKDVEFLSNRGWLSYIEKLEIHARFCRLLFYFLRWKIKVKDNVLVSLWLVCRFRNLERIEILQHTLLLLLLLLFLLLLLLLLLFALELREDIFIDVAFVLLRKLKFKERTLCQLVSKDIVKLTFLFSLLGFLQPPLDFKVFNFRFGCLFRFCGSSSDDDLFLSLIPVSLIILGAYQPFNMPLLFTLIVLLFFFVF